MSDRTIGSILVVFSAGFAVYYTAWVVGLPFVEPDHPVHFLFPPTYLALVVPALMGLGFIGSLIAWTVYSIKSCPEEKRAVGSSRSADQIH